MQDQPSGDAEAGATGQGRRRARTRAALLDAGRQLIGEGRENASIEEITRLAGVGFGSFTNHFPDGKEDFFGQAAHQVLTEMGLELQSVTRQRDDPAEAMALGFRSAALRGLAQPNLLQVLLRSGSQTLFVADTLRTAALADIERGMQAGVFLPGDPICQLTAVGSILLGTMRLLGPEGHRHTVALDDDATIDAMATAALLALGTDSDRARAAVAAVHDAGAWQHPSR